MDESKMRVVPKDGEPFETIFADYGPNPPHKGEYRVAVSKMVFQEGDTVEIGSDVYTVIRREVRGARRRPYLILKETPKEKVKDGKKDRKVTVG